MKKKELKNLANKIAQAERVIQTSSNKTEIFEAEQRIIELSGRATNIEDMMQIDEMVQEILAKV